MKKIIFLSQYKSPQIVSRKFKLIYQLLTSRCLLNIELNNAYIRFFKTIKDDVSLQA